MSEKTNGEQERFSIDDIIAEVNAERGRAPRTEEKVSVEPDGLPDLLIPEARIKQLHTEPDGQGADEADRAAGTAEKEPLPMPPRRPRAEVAPEPEPKGDVIVDDQELHRDKAPGRRVILFKSRHIKAEAPTDAEAAAEGDDQSEEAEDEKFVPYPVSDDDEEYYVEEEYYEEEEEELPYDFLNVPFDDPTRAVKKLGKKLMGMSSRLLFSGLLLAVTGWLTFAEALGLPGLVIEGVEPALLKGGLLALCTFLSLLCSWEVTTAGVWRLTRLRPTLDSLVVFSAMTSIAHCVFMALGLSDGQPLAFVSCMCCFFALSGKRSRAMTLRRTYKCMEIAADPTAVKVVGGKNYRSAIKTHNRAYAEVTDVAGMDMAERTSCLFAPVAIVASVALAVVASFGKGDAGRFIWSLAVISSVVAPCALCTASAGPWARVGKRLFTSGAAILDHRAAARLAKVRRVALYDGDIFPLGAVYIAGMKITSSTIKMEQVVADAAAVMKEVGGGVAKAFGDFAREQYLVPRRAINVRYFEGGGIAAQVQGDYVLMGSAAFLQKMGVMIHEGSDKKDAVFVSVNSYEAAIFTLKYTVQPQPYAAFGILSRFSITADLAVKDFGVTERLVENRFAIGRKLLNIPELSIKEAYWNEELGRDEPVCAILTRDSVLAFSEVIGGAKCLMRTVHLSLFCAYACSIIGMVTMYFLAAMDKIYLASPENIALYLLVWLLPVKFASVFMTRY